MPRLGGTSGSPTRRRSNGGGNFFQQWIATTTSSSRMTNVRNILLFLTAFFVMRNILRKDYRQEEMKYLREAGLSDEQVHRYVPRTYDEQRKYVENKANDVEKMKKDIAYLLNEVAELKTRNKSAQEDENHETQHHHLDVRGEALKSVDQLHAEKRKRQEEELVKANPDFHASKRVKDMTEEEIQKALRK